MRRATAAALVSVFALAVLPRSVVAQGEDAAQLRPGTLRITLAPDWSRWDHRFGEGTPGYARGALEPAGIDFSSDSLGVGQLPFLQGVQTRVRNITGLSAFRLNLGRAQLTLNTNVRVVPLGTTPSHFRPGIDPRPVRVRYGLDGGPWLLTVARLESHKGVDTVIRALPAVRAAFPGARYAVAGVGPHRSELERGVAELGLGDAVRFLGFVGDDELPALYNAADLYVGASRRVELLAEGFGIALVEASACGLAVVGGRSGGVPDAVREGETGLLVDPDDPAAVAEGITRLLGDDELRRRMGVAGRRAVETYYNWDRVARDLMQIDAEFQRR